MKKRFLALLATAIMVVSSTVMTYADTTTGLIGQFKFDGDLKNEVTGESGVPVTQKIAAEEPDFTFNYVDGVDGSAIYMNENGDTHGIDLKIKPTDGKAYSISVWTKALGCNFANPIVWAGKKTQAPECWVGIWPGLFGDYAKGPALGSNNADNTRPAVEPSLNDGTKYGAGIADAPTTYDWINVTITVNNGIGTLYYNGICVGQTAEGGATLPDIIADGDDTVSVYLGANAWDAPFNGYVDDLYVYDRVLSAADVKELVEATNVNKVAIKTDYEVFETPEPIETTSNKPTTAGGNPSYLTPVEPTTAANSDSGNDNTAMIVIAAVVIVVIVVVVVVAVVAGKKKAAADDEE